MVELLILALAVSQFSEACFHYKAIEILVAMQQLQINLFTALKKVENFRFTVVLISEPEKCYWGFNAMFDYIFRLDKMTVVTFWTMSPSAKSYQELCSCLKSRKPQLGKLLKTK